jgi:putative ubiquitin-RnfH superfamily antitoxin RatB of RatAB toxin-antitoxin module
VLSDSDRLELLRPLHADPKDQRRAKIKAARKLRRPVQAKPT